MRGVLVPLIGVVFGAALVLVVSIVGSTPHKTVDAMAWLEGGPVSDTNSAEARAFKELVQPYTERGVVVPRQIFESHYSELGPSTMLDVLDEDPTCHVAAHELGRVIYAHTQNIVDSLAICQNKCADGCIHGALLELYHAPEGPQDPDPAALSASDTRALAATCDDTTIRAAMGEANCYHAIGHILDALVDASTTRAIGMCDSFYKKTSPSAAYFCATGVYMQESLAVPIESHTMRDVESCEKDAYPAACYRFYLFGAFHAAHDPIGDASAYCKTLSGYQRLGCFNGVGADWYYELHKKPSAVNALCAQGEADDERMCLEGALQLLNVYYPGESSRVCAVYKGDASRCADASRYFNFDMNRDLTLYFDH